MFVQFFGRREVSPSVPESDVHAMLLLGILIELKITIASE
jgi:hypothetical protein